MEEANQINQNQNSDGGKLEKKLAECGAKRDEYLAGWQRAKADFINYKKEELQRLQEFARYGSAEMMRDLLGVVDSFDLAIAYAEKQGAAPTLQSESRPGSVGMEKGIYIIRGQIEETLRRYGLQKIELPAKALFDPSVHEAVGEVESEESPGTVIEEVSPGYRLHERVLRPARVRIAKAKP